MRIVSLIPSATEIVCALGARDQLVGRSHECDFPADVTALPALTRPRLPLTGGSLAIDQAVTRALTDGIAVYEVDLDLLAQLAPDVIVTQDQCEVCAASLAQVEEAVCAVLPSRPAIVSLKPSSLADAYEDVRRVAAALNRDPDPVVAAMQLWIERPARLPTPPRVVFLEWVAPLMGPGLWTPELIEVTGGLSVLGDKGKHTIKRAPDALAAAAPDILVVAPCGYDIATSLNERDLLTALPGWADIPAVRLGRVAIADGNAYFNRPGPRLADSAEILRDIYLGRPGDGQRYVWLHEV
ncbi:MAG: ABC transporter substrate-binding protein [Micropepsaceae bacterium]